MKSFVLGGGCFWCLDAAYRQLRGITNVVSGYAGGELANPSYEAVCGGNTGHAEVVRIDFDESQVSQEVVLDAFFVVHDPTQLNRQGADVGTQYRSVMLYADEEQRIVFEASIERAKDVWGEGVVTEVLPLQTFWVAEEYHQNYFARNPYQGYCMAVVAPKALKVRQKFADLMR